MREEMLMDEAREAGHQVTVYERAVGEVSHLIEFEA